ncbi:MAG TPA: hypothetical protein VGL38_14415 [bacterium]|jgi:hypothetical protein
MDGTPEFVSQPSGRTEVVAPPVIKKVSWGAIFVGAFVSLAVLATLALLGLAVGLGAFNPDRYVNPLSGITAGTGIWWLIISIIAFFVGGWAASRLITPLYQTENVLHGVASWAVAAVAMIVMATSAAGLIMGGALGVVSNTVRYNGPGSMISSTLFGAPMGNNQGWGAPVGSGYGYGGYGTNYNGQGMGGQTSTGSSNYGTSGTSNNYGGASESNQTGSTSGSSYPSGTSSTDTGSYSRSTYGTGTSSDMSGSSSERTGTTSQYGTSGSSDKAGTSSSTMRQGRTSSRNRTTTGTSSTYGTGGTGTDNTGNSNMSGTAGSGYGSNRYGGTNMYGGSGMGNPDYQNYQNAQARQIATQAAHTAATAAGWTFVMLLLSLAASALGAGLSAPKNIPAARNMP